MTEERTDILVVEDSRTQLAHLTHILESGGFQVTGAPDGASALDLLSRHRPALVLSDIMMPGMDGYTLCRTIKENPEFADLPVILVTYLSDTADVLQGLDAGADNFIMKPYEPQFLLKRIRRTLEASRTQRDPSPSPLLLQFEGRTYSIRSDRRQILEILLSTYDTALQKQNRLRAAQDELRAANQELEAFSYSVSHDLRSPLSAIQGFSDYLGLDYRDALGDKGLRYLGLIRQATEKMNQLIDDLLKLSRATRAEMKRMPIDLSAMLREIEEELRREEPQRQVTFEIEEGMSAHGDPALVRIAFENLLRNAWKFTSRREQACIGVHWKPEKKLYVVSDNGAGFDMKDADKMFTSFRRLHNQSDYPGTGLGLTIVQRIVQRHGGHIHAEAKVDEGARFYVTL